ncbi:MAG: hypothetical protein BGO98_09110 [Myxococcales bacterium 68-20]|nr:glycosyltransferase family 2 protein [Myxococcales bacterium]OJY25146.1 MAG: hypothetical protein BGO98_09110 [Myxococcales bacterium 68-20]
MSGPAPLLSICMPVYNGMPFLESTLDSVLAQSFTDYEVVIRDDRSTDGTWEWLNQRFGDDPRFVLHRNETNLDVGPQYERLFREARGTYVLKLDSDDLIEPEMCARLIALAESTGADFVAARFEWLDTTTGARTLPRVATTIPEGDDPEPVATVLLHNPYSLCFSIWRRALLERTEFDGQHVLFTETCDWEFQLRLALVGAGFHTTRQTLGYYRLHQSNRSYMPFAQLNSNIADVLPYWRPRLIAAIGRGRWGAYLCRLLSDYLRAALRGGHGLDLGVLRNFARLFSGRTVFPRWCFDPGHMAAERASRAAARKRNG